MLFHDIKKATAEALDGVLTELEKEGYKFVQVVSNTYYQPDSQLLAHLETQRRSPQVAMDASRDSKEQIKDGSVDIMHTEWIDLDAEIANEKLNSSNAGNGASQNRAGVQQGTMYTASGWAPAPRVR